MLRLLILLATGVALGILILGCQAECNACSTASNVSCASNTTFQFCSDDSVPIQPAYSCPPGYYCTATTVICSKSVALRACNCGSCNDYFACLTDRTYALCLGSSSPSQLGGSCGSDHVCDSTSPYICVNATSGSQPTCPADSDTSPGGVDPIGLTPTAYCGIIQQTGKFPYGIDPETTCRQYISCTVNATSLIWKGALNDCPGLTYYDSSTKYCTTKLPPRCSAGVATLSLSNLYLL
ncbi:GL10345 [Drosophila persimilis]|uniref:GL10345 n=1 Tax=Drosophila persimilis TaxID=7234 RepID=B4H9L8_DROPE|nr:uncharacterized protein LOC6602505 [Drosophila persimilis]EDW36494.1 GL10345 [Drosophila persimilis]